MKELNWVLEMLVLAFGPFAFVEIFTLGFSWGWAVWGWRMFHISGPVTPRGRWEELDWELWAHLSTTFPRGDYCSTWISMLCCTTDSGFSWQQLLILWPRGLSTLESPTESQTWDKTASRESQHSLCCHCFGLFCGEVEKLQRGQRVGTFPAGASSLDHLWELCEQPRLLCHHCT